MNHHRLLAVFFILLTFHQLKAGNIVTIIQATNAQILLDNKVVGNSELPVGQDYQLLGVMNNQFLLQQGNTRFLVDPLATDYWEHDLLSQLRPTPETKDTPPAEPPVPPTPYVADVTIYPAAPSTPVAPPDQPVAVASTEAPVFSIRQPPEYVYSPDISCPYPYVSVTYAYAQPYYVQPYYAQPYPTRYFSIRGRSPYPGISVAAPIITNGYSHVGIPSLVGASTAKSSESKSGFLLPGLRPTEDPHSCSCSCSCSRTPFSWIPLSPTLSGAEGKTRARAREITRSPSSRPSRHPTPNP